MISPCCDVTQLSSDFSPFNSMYSHTLTQDSIQDLPSQSSIDSVTAHLIRHSPSALSANYCTCPAVCNCSHAKPIHPPATSTVLDPSVSSNTSPVPHLACFQNNHIPGNVPETFSCCPDTYFSGGEAYMAAPEEQKEAKRCAICKASVENKVRMEQDRQFCECFLNSLSRFKDWLQTAQIAASLWNPSQTLHKESKLALRKYEVLLKEMQEKLLDLESLNRQYWRLTQTRHQTLLPSVLRSRMQEVNKFWYHLQREAETVHQTLKSRVQQREEFDTEQEDMKLCLTEMDLELSSVEYIYSGNSTEKIQQLKVFQEDVWSNMKRMECLLERGDLLMDNSDPQDAEILEEEMTELGSYCQEIFTRLSRLQKRLVSTKLVFEDDFLDSGFEHASSGSSDVFLDLDIEEEAAPSPLNVPASNVALPVDLEWDPLGDVGRSSSHDGQESFYTATSAPWKIFQRSEGSLSSVGSDLWVTSSISRKQEDQEPSTGVPTSQTPLCDTCNLKGTQDQMIRATQDQINHKEQVEDTTVLQNSLPGMETVEVEKTFSCSETDSVVRMDNYLAPPGHHWNNPKQLAPLTPDAQVSESQSQRDLPGHRRRQGKKKKRGVLTQDGKRKMQPTRQEVAILMEDGEDTSHVRPHKTSYRSPGFLWLRVRRWTPLLVLFLLLGGSLLILPLGRPSFSSQRFTWSLMLTYVNGPPPT